MTTEKLGLDVLTQANFAPLVGSLFRMQMGPDQSIEIELIEATLAPGVQLEKGRPFSLLFIGPLPACARLNQRIYALEHESLGTLEIFLVPLGPDKKGMRFEAIFN